MHTDTPFIVAGSGQSNFMANAASTDGIFVRNPHVTIWDAQQAVFEELNLANQQHFCLDSQAVAGWNAVGNGRNHIFGGMGHELYGMFGGRPVKFIANGRGGVPLYKAATPGEDWVGLGTASKRYIDLKADIEAALVAAGRTTIDAFCFQQGETDFLEGRTVAQYIADFQTLLAQLRSESWFPANTPVLCGQPAQGWAATTSLANLMAAKEYLTGDSDPYTYLVRSEGLPSDTTVVGNSIHFSGLSLYTLGLRYAVAMGAFYKPQGIRAVFSMRTRYGK